MGKRVLCFISLLAVIILTACANPPRTAKQPPIYPNASNVTTQVNGSVTYVRFESEDSPESIVAYYEDTLQKDGWALHVPLLPLTPSPTPSVVSETRYFDWYSSSAFGPPSGYILELVVTPTGGLTKVEIELVIDLGR